MVNYNAEFKKLNWYKIHTLKDQKQKNVKFTSKTAGSNVAAVFTVKIWVKWDLQHFS